MTKQHGSSLDIGRKDHSWMMLTPNHNPRLPPMIDNIVTGLKRESIFLWRITLEKSCVWIKKILEIYLTHQQYFEKIGLTKLFFVGEIFSILSTLSIVFSAGKFECSVIQGYSYGLKNKEKLRTCHYMGWETTSEKE